MHHRCLPRFPFALAALLATLGLPVHAQGTTKPGLWEIQHSVGGAQAAQANAAMAQMRERLASMPPEQRKMVEEMMARQGVGMAPGGGSAVRICISKEMAERGELPTQQEGDCKTTIVERGANRMKMQFTCSSPPSSGEGLFQFQGDTAYTMNMTVNAQRQGRTETMTMQAQGRWVGADCGSLKPPTAR